MVRRLIGFSACVVAAVAVSPLASALAQSYSLPDGGSVEVSIGDTGGSVSVTSPSTGIDFSTSFSFGTADPGSVSTGGSGGSGSGAIAVSRARAVAIPGLSTGPTAGGGGSEGASRSIASGGKGGRTATGLQGEWVDGVQGPGYSVPGFAAGPIGSYGVDAPPGPTPDGQGSYTAQGGSSPTQPSDASYAVSAPDAAPGETGAGAGQAPAGFNPITADQGTPIGGIGVAGIGPPATGRPGGDAPPALPGGVAAPLGGPQGLAIQAPVGPTLGGQGLTTGSADKAPPANPPPPRPEVTVIVVSEESDLFDEIADLLGVSRDDVFAVYEENAARLSDLVSSGDRDGLIEVLSDLAGQLLDGPRGPAGAGAAPGGFQNLARQ